MHYPGRPSSRKAMQTGTIPSPEDFRASTTGIGATLAASQRTGAIRAQRVSDSCDPQCAKNLPRSYPRPSEAGGLLSGMTPTGMPAPAKPARVRTTHPAVTDKTL
jgi:hypothetical protein